jgi:hypothetical protein
MILTGDVIRREIEAGRVVIDPFSPDQVGPASIDLHLGDEIRVMHDGREPVPVTDDVDFRTITDVRSLETPYPLALARPFTASRASASPCPATSAGGSKAGAASRASAS